VIRQQLEVPSSTFGVATTDTRGSWVIDGTSGSVVVRLDGADPAAVVRGTAEHVLLALWGRPVPDGALTLEGDQSVCDSWLSLGGA
jgi:hypothetical protein